MQNSKICFHQKTIFDSNGFSVCETCGIVVEDISLTAYLNDHQKSFEFEKLNSVTNPQQILRIQENRDEKTVSFDRSLKRTLDTLRAVCSSLGFSVNSVILERSKELLNIYRDEIPNKDFRLGGGRDACCLVAAAIYFSCKLDHPLGLRDIISAIRCGTGYLLPSHKLFKAINIIHQCAPYASSFAKLGSNQIDEYDSINDFFDIELSKDSCPVPTISLIDENPNQSSGSLSNPRDPSFYLLKLLTSSIQPNYNMSLEEDGWRRIMNRASSILNFTKRVGLVIGRNVAPITLAALLLASEAEMLYKARVVEIRFSDQKNASESPKVQVKPKISQDYPLIIPKKRGLLRRGRQPKEHNPLHSLFKSACESADLSQKIVALRLKEIRSMLRNVALDQKQLLHIVEDVNIAEILDEILLALDPAKVRVNSKADDCNIGEKAIGPPSYISSNVLSKKRLERLKQLSRFIANGDPRDAPQSMEDFTIQRLLINGVLTDRILECSTTSQLYALESLVFPSLELLDDM